MAGQAYEATIIPLDHQADTIQKCSGILLMANFWIGWILLSGFAGDEQASGWSRASGTVTGTVMGGGAWAC